MSSFTTKTNATITIYRDDSDPNNTGWAYRVVGEGQNESGPIDDLHDLLAVLGEHEPVDLDELDDLPTFDDVLALRARATQAGDHAVIGICDCALAGDVEAWLDCYDVMTDIERARRAVMRAVRPARKGEKCF